MLRRINNGLERVFGPLLAALFAGLILVVFAQVTARNVLEIPLIWTLDLAQLLFSWCIFLGAAFAFRRGEHYHVDLWPTHGPLRWIPLLVPLVASAVVIYVLVRHGVIMSEIGLNRLSPSLGISEFWFFLPIPIGGALMGFFLLERVADLGRQ
ncbi:MAG: TRAP transporter small permease [Devosia sp.]